MALWMKRVAAGCGAVLLACPIVASAAEPVVVTSTSFRGETWIKPTEPVRIRLDHMPSPKEGRIAVFIGGTDVTSQFKTSGNDLVYDPSIVRLPSGEQDISVHLVKGPSQWTEVGKMKLRVLTRAGFEKFNVTPHADISDVSTFDTNHSGDAAPIPHVKAAAGTFQTGIEVEAARKDAEFKTQFNFLGVTEPEQALEFSTEGIDAPRYDLSDYLVTLKNEDAEFQVGHITYGHNRHLLDQVAHRGVMGSYKFGDRITVSVASMNGSSIVGYDNFAGLNNRHNNITAGTIGVQLLKGERLDSLLETTLLTGQIMAVSDFNSGEVVDTEQSQGIGFRLLTNAFNRRARSDLSWARATDEHPFNPQTDFGSDVSIRKTTDDARYGDVSVDLLSERKLWGSRTVSFTATMRQERVNPQFRSLAAFTTADQEMNEVVLEGNVAGVAAQFGHAWTSDNLDNVPSILKTKTRAATFSVSSSLGTFTPEEYSGKSWWPVVSYTFNRVNQFSANRPLPEQSGFFPGAFGNNNDPVSAALPHLITTANTVMVGWTGERWNAQYKLARVLQDNRQVDMEEADVLTVTQGVGAGVKVFDKLNVNTSYEETRQHDGQVDMNRYTKTRSLGVDWEFLPKWNVTGNYSRTWEADSIGTASSFANVLETDLSRRFELPTGLDHRKVPGRVWLRYAYHSDGMSSGLLDLARGDLHDRFQSGEYWIFSGGMTLTFAPSN